MVKCKMPVHQDDHMQEAGCQDDNLQEAGPSGWSFALVISRCLSLIVVCRWSLFVAGHCLSFVFFVIGRFCHWLLFVVGHCLSLVILFHWLLFVFGCLSLFVVGRCLLMVVVCCLLLIVVCRGLLFVVGRCLLYLSYLVSTIIFGMLELSGFQKYSILLLF